LSLRLIDCVEEYVKKLMGRTDIEDALARLDQLMRDEVRMTGAHNLKETHEVGDKVQCVNQKVQDVNEKLQRVDDRGRDIDDKMELLIDST
jgi:hypothetical protein